jgi:hypothetical protein
MKMELFEQGIKVGEVTVDPYSYTYEGNLDEVEDYLSSNPEPLIGINDPDDPNQEGNEIATGFEKLQRIGRQVKIRGVWSLNLVEE